ncbi:hypothetical protein FRC17_007303 [Serendipita sp. 399]|nr:hypothetical protein FRC17_007303 [Serendipita sp. 399]
MESLFDAPEGSPGASAYDIGYQFLRQIFDQGLAVTLYNSLSHEDPVMPHQRTLLKLLDGYLQALPSSSPVHSSYALSMPRLYTSLASKTYESIKSSLSGDGTNFTPDPHLPVLSEALVLAAQCCQLLLLRESETILKDGETSIYRAMEQETSDGEGCIELTIDILRELSVLLPRIAMGKAVPVPLSKTRPPTETDPTEFPYLKRDLIRLLGTLAYQNRTVQDRIRQRGGIQMVMNHCMIDERNPYLREHAIFALRNLLEHNIENQDVVREMKPLRGFDAEGILRDMAE